MTDFLFNENDVLTVVNASEARDYIGKQGYFADQLYKDLNSWTKAKLIDVHPHKYIAGVFVTSDTNGYFEPVCFGLFLPVDKVNIQVGEAKYRPFNDFEEFKDKTHLKVGSCVTLRAKDKDCDTEYISETLITNMVIEYKQSKLEEQSIYFGFSEYTFTELLAVYEYKNPETGEWCRFGVKE